MNKADECMEFMARQLSEVMEKNNWSITTAAYFMGIGRKVLSKILGSNYNVHLSTIFHIAENLDMPVASLICPEGEYHRKNELLLRQIQTSLDELKDGVA